jgi:phenylpropionate dioxygenase-like ring-hydroxylating dioxygenase large terminal subunit
MSSLEDRLHETRLGLARRLATHIANDTSDLADGPMRNLASAYVDPERHALERQKLFRETPVVACLSADLKEPGSFRTFDETGVPIVIVRGRDGTLRGFLNICTHRGARLVHEAEGKAKLFTCWFHGWSFAAEGQLVAATESERFGDAVKERDHLIPVPVAERHGLVFVKATPNSTMDIDAHLATFAPQLELLQLDRAERVKDGVLPVAANWKYALDTYSEGYHFAALHKETLAPYFRNDITVFDRFAPHHRVLFVSREMETWRHQPEEEWGVDHHIGGIHYIFPNTILFAGSVSPGKGYYTLFRHFPGEAVGETKTYKTIYAPKGVTSEAYRKEVEDAFDATAYVVINEDYVAAAEGWRNMTHLPEGATVVYGRQEIGVQYQHKAIAEALGIALHQPPVRQAAE